jgi:hypothetical protein
MVHILNSIQPFQIQRHRISYEKHPGCPIMICIFFLITPLSISLERIPFPCY